jgi:hypothetical protein
MNCHPHQAGPARLYGLDTEHDPLARRTGSHDNGLLGALQPLNQRSAACATNAALTDAHAATRIARRGDTRKWGSALIRGSA